MSFFLAPNYPFSPRRWPFFYGWIILIVSTLGIVMSVPGQTIGVSVFTDFLMEALGLSRVQLSTAYMLGTILSSLCLPWSGRMFDRKGARFMVVFSSVILMATLLYLSQCDRIVRLLTVSGLPWIRDWTNFTVIFTGFFFLRFSGQGMLCMTARSMLGKWFDRKRGLASGINGIVVTFSFSIAPLAFDRLVLAFDWREAWMMLAALTSGMAVSGWLFFRDTPEECGLVMDGTPDVSRSKEDDSETTKPQREYTLKEAKRSYSFWVFNFGLAAQSLIITALTFHIVSIGEQMGLNRMQALGIFLPMSFVSIATNFGFAWVSDRMPLKYMLALMMALLAMGVYGIPHFAQGWGRVMVIAGFGGSGGIFGPLVTVVWPNFYGRKHLGEIAGLNMSILVFASAIGPVIFGLSYEWLGSYQPGVYFCLVMPVVFFLAAFKADDPQQQFHSTSS